MNEDEFEGYQDPSSLKEKDENFDENLIETLKKSEGVRWPGALMLMGVTLLVGLGLGWLILNDRNQVQDRDAETPVVNAPLNQAESIEIQDNVALSSFNIDMKAVETSEGTFTEWFLYEDGDERPNFVDMAWHPTTDVIYLAGRDTNLYWIEPDRQKIYYKDLSLRLGESLPWLESISVLDEDRLLLTMDNNETPFIIYNVTTDRVEKRFGEKSKSGGAGTFNLIADQGTVIGPNGTIYVINTISQDGDYLDEIQVFDSSGESIKTIPIPRAGDSIAVDERGHIFVIGGFRNLFEYDPDGNLVNQIQREPLDYVTDMTINSSGEIFFIRKFDAWFVEIEPNGEFGQILGPSADLDLDEWDLGQVRSPIALAPNPNQQEYLILDGYYDYKRLFLFKPKQTD